MKYWLTDRFGNSDDYDRLDDDAVRALLQQLSEADEEHGTVSIDNRAMGISLAAIPDGRILKRYAGDQTYTEYVVQGLDATARERLFLAVARGDRDYVEALVWRVREPGTG